jgi:hypothetical protein
MHLLGPAYTTTNHKKRKSKLNDVKYTMYAIDWRADCAMAKRFGLKQKTLEEYIAYRQGNYKPKLRGTKMPEYNVSDHRSRYPSESEIGVNFTKNTAYEQEKLRVSSSYVVGQAYNKGGLVVLSKSETADPATGKRR